jgi:hypothetical protein
MNDDPTDRPPYEAPAIIGEGPIEDAPLPAGNVTVWGTVANDDGESFVVECRGDTARLRITTRRGSRQIDLLLADWLEFTSRRR